MSAQDIIIGARAVHIRELKSEIDHLKADNVALTSELTALRAHFDLALLAAMDLRLEGTLEIWDGWNLILGATKVAKDRGELLSQAQASGRRIWIVYDGHDENSNTYGKVRVSYTGGKGEHRADKFIIDFVRMARYLGLADKITVRTNDKDFLKSIRKLQASN